MTDKPTHIISVVNKETEEFRVVYSASGEKEAKVVFENVLGITDTKCNRVHMFEIPSQTGFVSVEVISAPEHHQPASAGPSEPPVATPKPEPFKRTIPDDEPTDANGFPVGKELEDGYGRTI